MESKMHPIVGAVYPVPDHLKDRLFNGGIKVFVKFLAHNSTRLRRNSKVIFYASGRSKKLVGEGTIVRVEFLTPDIVITKYRDKLFISEDEFNAYINSSSMRTASKEVLTLVLKELRKYPEPISYSRPITMAGLYLTAAEYNSLVQTKSQMIE